MNIRKTLYTLVMGPGQKCLTKVRSFFCCLVGSATSGFRKKSQIFQFFPFGSKRISSGWVKKCLDQRYWDGLLFTVGQKYAWKGSWSFSSTHPTSNLYLNLPRGSTWLMSQITFVKGYVVFSLTSLPLGLQSYALKLDRHNRFHNLCVPSLHTLMHLELYGSCSSHKQQILST